MKKIFIYMILIFSMILGMAFPAMADEEDTDPKRVVDAGACGDYLGWYLLQDGTLEIRGTGEMRNYEYPSYSPWYEYREYIKGIEVLDGATYIGNCAFYDCRQAESVRLPESLTSIGDSAFVGCSALTEVTIPDSVTAIGVKVFSGCTNLARVHISEGLTYIGDSDFHFCSSLASVVIPEKVTQIGTSAFSLCSALSSVTFSNGLLRIERTAFYDCTSLTEVQLPEGLNYIGISAFCGCTGMTDITVPASVTSIGSCALGVKNDSTTPPEYIEGFTISGYHATTAEQYAADNGITFNLLGKARQVVTGTAYFTTNYGTGSFTLDAKSFGDGALTYISDDETVAVVDSRGTVTINGIGTADISVSAAETENFYASDVFTVTVEITKDTQTINGTDQYSVNFGDSFIIDAQSSGDGPLVYASDNESVAAVDSTGNVTLNGVGTANITVYADESETCFKSDVFTTVVTVGKGSQQISGTANYIKSYSVPSFKLDEVSNGDGTLMYVSDNEAVAVVDSTGRVTLKGAGKASITIYAQESQHYSASDPFIVSVMVAKAPQIVIGTKSYTKCCGDDGFTLNASSLGNGVLKYKSYNKAVAVVDSTGKVTVKGVGTVKIRVYAQETENYERSNNFYIVIKVNPKGTSLSSLTAVKKGFTVKWKKQAVQTTGYQIQYSTDSGFSKSKTVTVKDIGTTAKTITVQKSNTQYYIRVRTYKTVSGTNYYSSWSSVKKIKTK